MLNIINNYTKTKTNKRKKKKNESRELFQFLFFKTHPRGIAEILCTGCGIRCATNTASCCDTGRAWYGGGSISGLGGVCVCKFTCPCCVWDGTFAGAVLQIGAVKSNFCGANFFGVYSVTVSLCSIKNQNNKIPPSTNKKKVKVKKSAQQLTLTLSSFHIFLYMYKEI